MIPVFLGQNNYKNMLELQEKLRKSEEERIRLEERFSLIQQQSRLKHETCINKLRMRYIEFLEEQRVRDERNHKLLSALDRVDESLALMSAKTDRLYTLRKEYDSSLMRVDADRRQIGSVTGDSGVVSQNEDRQFRINFRQPSFVAPRSRYEIDRRFRNVSAPLGNSASSYNFMNTSRPYLDYPSSSLKFTRKPLANRGELFLENRQSQAANYGENNELQMSLGKAENHTWGDGHTIDDIDQMRKRDACENLLTKESLPLQYPKRLESLTTTPKLTSILGTLLNSKEERIGSVLENELDRYIHKIRSLHDNTDPHSLEEIEQNTSGDLLNVTLSDDGLDHLPIEEKKRTPEIPTEVKGILEIADELVRNTADDYHTEDNTSDAVICQSPEELTTDVNAGQKLSSESALGNRVAVINAKLSNSNMQIVTSTPMCTSVSKDKISDDVAIPTTKLNPPAKSTETLTKLMTIDDTLRSNSEQSQEGNIKFPEKHQILADTTHHLEIVDSQKLHDEHQEADSSNYLESVNEPESCATDNLQIESEKISTDDNSKSSNGSSNSKANVPSLTTNDRISKEKDCDEDIIEKSEIDITHEIITDTNNQSNGKDEINIENAQSVDYNTAEQNYESSPEQQLAQSYEQEAQEYLQDPNQIYEYNNEQYHHDLHQQYPYDQNLPYEQDPNGQYQYDQLHSQYVQDPNAQYQDQQYADNEDQQYVINSNEQYHEYSGDVNQDYQSEAYVRDPNAVYDPNAIYTYPTQTDDYTANNTYDELQPPVPDQYHQEYQEQSDHNETRPNVNDEAATTYHTADLSNKTNDNNFDENCTIESSGKEEQLVNEDTVRKSKDVIKYILDSDTDSNMEKNISNTESDFDFN